MPRDCHESPPCEPVRHRLPDTRKTITHKFEIDGLGFGGEPKTYTGYLRVGLYPDGSPGEVFCTFAKMGGRQGALIDAWCTAVSLMLQHGIQLDSIIAKFKAWGFEPAGRTGSQVPELRVVKSPLDYIVRWLEWKFIRPEREST